MNAVLARKDAQELVELAVTCLGAWNDAFQDIRLVKFRENAVFSVRNAAGERFALRVHRAGYHGAGQIRSELEFTRLLSEGGLSVPFAQPSRNGDCVVEFDVPGMGSQAVDLLHWLDGQPLSAIEEEALCDSSAAFSLYHAIGATAARVHAIAGRATLPDGFDRPRWDADGLVGAAPLWGRFWELDLLDPAQSSLIRSLRKALARDLADVPRDSASFGLIHGDMLADNILVEGNSVRLIDFDDCGWGWFLFELATVLHFQIGHPLYDSIYAGLLAGYRSVRPLSAQDEARLPLFIALRSTTYLGWVHTRANEPAAVALAPALIERCCMLAASYLAQHHPDLLPAGDLT